MCVSFTTKLRESPATNPQMTALGVLLHRGSYLRGFFNIMDFVITMTTLIPIISYFYNLSKSGGDKEK